MIVRIVVYGLCVVEEGDEFDTIYAVPHYVDAKQNHRFILQAKAQHVDYSDLPQSWYRKIGSSWYCELPDKAALTIPQPDRGVTPTELERRPVSLGDLGLEFLAKPPKRLGMFTLPHPKNDPPRYKWVDHLGEFKLKCGTAPGDHDVADRFVWVGNFQNPDQAKVEITYQDNGQQTRELILEKDGVELDVICIDPDEEEKSPFTNWKSFMNVAKVHHSQDCKPVLQRADIRIRSINSPSCPPVKA